MTYMFKTVSSGQKCPPQIRHLSNPTGLRLGSELGTGLEEEMAEYHLPTASLLGSELQGTATVLLSPGWSLTSDIGAVTAS